MTKDMQILLDYCKDTIQDFEERVSMAIDKIAYWRCSLEYADPDLCDEIADAIALVKGSDCSLDEMESKDANVAFLHRDWDWMHDVLADCCDQDIPGRYGIYSCDLDDCDEIVSHY